MFLFFLSFSSFQCPSVINRSDYAIFYVHQTSSTCAGMCTCNHTHQMEKTDVSSLPQKSLFILSMVQALINSQLKLVVLLLDFSWSRYKDRQERNNRQNLQNIFVLNLEWLQPYFSTSGILPDNIGNWAEDNGFS